MKKKVEFLVKTAAMLFICVAMMGACCQVCKDGECGEDGPQGQQGPQGIPGNAGAKMYIYGSKTSVVSGIPGVSYDSNTLTYAIPLSAEALGKSEVYAYYKSETDEWFPAAGILMWRNYIKTLSFLSGSNYIVSFFDADEMQPYPESFTFYGFKIIVVPIPDENMVEIKSAVSIDFGNYDEVAAYYGFPE